LPKRTKLFNFLLKGFIILIQRSQARKYVYNKLPKILNFTAS